MKIDPNFSTSLELLQPSFGCQYQVVGFKDEACRDSKQLLSLNATQSAVINDEKPICSFMFVREPSQLGSVTIKFSDVTGHSQEFTLLQPGCKNLCNKNGKETSYLVTASVMRKTESDYERRSTFILLYSKNNCPDEHILETASGQSKIVGKRKLKPFRKIYPDANIKSYRIAYEVFTPNLVN